LIGLHQVKYKPISEIMTNTTETGFYDYDSYVFDLKPQELTIIFGRNGEGKSTVASQIIAHHINAKKKAYLFSGELGNNKIQEWLYRQIIGGENDCYRSVSTKYGYVDELKPQIVDMIKRWHQDRLFVFDTKAEVKKNTTLLFEDMKKAKVKGCDLFVIDNMMSAQMVSASSEYADQSNFVQMCHDFAVIHDVHVILIAHPNKHQDELDAEATEGNLTKLDISGSNNIPNKADNIIAVERIWHHENHDSYDLILTSLKDRFKGERKVFKYLFSHKSLRFYNNSTPQHVNYDWRREGNQTTAPY